jgi:hypothetical protein
MSTSAPPNAVANAYSLKSTPFGTALIALLFVPVIILAYL